ncbi:MAG: choice-of-anchor Q domain-containing protein [Limisphaerales bacterium]
MNFRTQFSSAPKAHEARQWKVSLLTSATTLIVTLSQMAGPAFGAVLRVPADHATIQRAVDAAKPGDTVLVSPGKYSETVTTKVSGTPTQPITIDGANKAALNQVVLRHSHIRLQNLEISGAPQSYQRLLYFDLGAHFCVVSNNVIDLANARSVYGIEWRMSRIKPFGVGDAASDNLVISNTVKNCSAFIMMSVMGDRNVIQGNRLIDSPNADMFRLFGRSNVIRGNFCLNSPHIPNLGNHPDFIQTFGNNGDGSRGHIIEDNVAIKLEGAQITQLEGNLMPEISDWTFRNNLFVDVALQASCTIPRVKYYNNTFIRCNYKNGGHALTFSVRTYQSFSTYTGATGNNYAHEAQVFNNVFVDCGITNYNRGWYGFSSELNGIAANYNYVGKNGYLPVREDKLRRAIGSSGGWDTFGWFEPNGVNGGDPRFVNPSVANYRLLSNSPIADTGTPLAIVPRDFDGVPRPQGSGWSMGAFEPLSSIIATRPQPVSNLRVVLQ